MTIAYNGTNKMRVPDFQELNWHTPLNENFNILAATNENIINNKSVLSGLVASDGGNGQLNITAGRYCIGAIDYPVPSSSFTIASGNSVIIYIDANNTLQSTTSLPTTGLLILYYVWNKSGILQISSLANKFIPQKNKNLLINGNFDKWQRASTQTISGYGSVDRWRSAYGGSTATVSQQSHTMADREFFGARFFTRIVTTSVAGAENYCQFDQFIEDGIIITGGRTVTLSFYARASTTGKYVSVELTQNVGTGGSPSGGAVGLGITKFALTTSWVKYTATVTLPSIASYVLGTNNNHSLRPVFWLDAGSNYNSRTDTLGQQSGTFDFAQIQLELGDTATPFEIRSAQEEWDLCYRYYQVIPLKGLSGVSYAPNGDTRARIPLLQKMRIAPAVSFSVAEPFSIIGSGYAGEVINVSLGFPTAISYTDVIVISNISGYAKIAGIGSVVTWGNNYESYLLLDAEIQ